MIRIAQLTGVPSLSGMMIIGQGYSHVEIQDKDILIDDGQPFTWNYKENYQKYIIRTNQTNQQLDFKPTTRFYEDGKIIIQSNQTSIAEIKDLNDNFLSGISSFAIEGTDQYFPAESTAPIFCDALAYNTLIRGKNYIDPINEWRWFRVECSDALGFFGECSGGSSQVSKNIRSEINYTGYYTNLFNIHPSDNDVWLYDLVEYVTQGTLVHAHAAQPQPIGANWGLYALGKRCYLYSGRKSAYYADGKPKFYPVQTYPFNINKNNIRWINKNSGFMCTTAGHGGPYYIFEYGISGFQNRYQNLNFTNIANSGERYLGLKSSRYGNFYYNSGINRWTFHISGNICYPSGYRTPRPGQEIYFPTPQIMFTGFTDSEYPWQTSWPSGIKLVLIN